MSTKKQIENTETRQNLKLKKAHKLIDANKALYRAAKNGTLKKIQPVQI